MKSVQTVAFILVALLATPNVGGAAENGTAYDVVSYSGQGASRSDPGDFDADFQAAQAPLTIPKFDATDPSKALADVQAMISRMAQVGMAARYYVAGSRQRFDSIAFQQATITDCATRTVVQLDYKTKTYTSSSLGDASRGPASTTPLPSYAMKVAVEALGPKMFGGVATDGYAAAIAATYTPAAGSPPTGALPAGSPMMMNFVMTEYFTKQAVSTPSCVSDATIAAVRGIDNSVGAVAAGDQFASLIRGAQGLDPHVKTEITGATMPTGRIPLFMTTTFQIANGPPGFPDFGYSMEFGHIRVISSDDPAFTIPADFTKAP